MACPLAEPRLRRRHAAEGRQDLGQVDAGNEVAVERVAPGKGGQGRAMNGAVLADLEGREVEPEGLHLPAEVLDLAPCDARKAVVGERRLQLGEVGDEVLHAHVSPCQCRRRFGQVGPRPPEPLRDRPEALAVWLVREALLELARDLGQLLRVHREPSPQAAREATARRGSRRWCC